MSDSFQPHESQHARPPCPSPTPGVHWDSRPSSQWCHPAISSSVVPFSSCPSVPPSIRVFSNESTLHMRWPKYWTFSFSIIPSYGHIIKSQKQKEEWTFERKPGECGQKSVFGAKQDTSWDAGEGGLKEKVSTNRDSFYLLTSRFAWWNEIEDGKMRRHRRWPSCC